MLKTAVLFLAAFTLFAQPKPTPEVIDGKVTEVKINTEKGLLEWKGHVIFNNGKKKKFKFVISPDSASMTTGKETRYFDRRELPRVEFCLMFLTTYAAESTIWWFQGKGWKEPRDPELLPEHPLDFKRITSH